VRHYSRLEERKPLTIVEWQEKVGALAVFNAGQYYPDYSYMGLLVSDGAASLSTTVCTSAADVDIPGL
jgi:uncharacterized protein YigE (DUF2233 family)